jgi:hypothetical protein
LVLLSPLLARLLLLALALAALPPRLTPSMTGWHPLQELQHHDAR